MKENRLTMFLLIFSLSLNLGIIGYLIYEKTAQKTEIIPKPPPTIVQKDSKSRRLPHHFIPSSRRKLTREERLELRRFFREVFKTLKPLIEKQVKLKGSLMKSIEDGEIEKTRNLVEEIHKNQAKIDIIFLEKATEEIKKFPTEKQKYITYIIMRFVSIGKRRRF